MARSASGKKIKETIVMWPDTLALLVWGIQTFIKITIPGALLLMHSLLWEEGRNWINNQFLFFTI